jgi:hypothetical protein
MNSPSTRRHWRASPVQVLSLLVVLLLGGFIVSSRVMAQTKPPKPVNNTLAAPAARAPAAAAPAAAPAPAPAPAPAAAPDDKGEKKESRAIDYAELGPNGGVPVHTEGPFKSPFAHPRFGGPCNVKVGFLLNHVRNYDIKEGTFEAEFYLSYTSDKPMPELDPDFTNGKIDDKEEVANTPTFKLYHMRGVFSSMPDLRNYPFDKQDLEIEIEDNLAGNDQINLIPDKAHTNLDAGFNMPGWLVEDYEARILNHYFPDRFEHDDLYYGRYHFILGIRRFATNAVFSVFVPAFVIVLISLTGLWLPREELEVRSNGSAPMLAAAVIFHFTLNQELPATPYLTHADKLMMDVYVALIINMIATWAWFLFDEKHTELIFKLGKRVVPPLTILIMILASSI